MLNDMAKKKHVQPESVAKNSHLEEESTLARATNIKIQMTEKNPVSTLSHDVKKSGIQLCWLVKFHVLLTIAHLHLSCTQRSPPSTSTALYRIALTNQFSAASKCVTRVTCAFVACEALASWGRHARPLLAHPENE